MRSCKRRYCMGKCSSTSSQQKLPTLIVLSLKMLLIHFLTMFLILVRIVDSKFIALRCLVTATATGCPEFLVRPKIKDTINESNFSRYLCTETVRQLSVSIPVLSNTTYVVICMVCNFVEFFTIIPYFVAIPLAIKTTDSTAKPIAQGQEIMTTEIA